MSSTSSTSLASEEEPEGFFLGLSWSLGNTPMGEQSFGQSSGSRGSASGSPCIFRRMSLPVWQHVWPGRSTPPALGCSNEKDISPVRARRANARSGPTRASSTTEISRPFRKFQRLCSSDARKRKRVGVRSGLQTPQTEIPRSSTGVLDRAWASRARGRHSETRERVGRGGESSRQARARESRREGEAATP